MIAETILSLVAVLDRLAQLIDRREKVNRNSFSDFVVPVMNDLEAVHQNYMERFGRYLRLLDDRSVEVTSDHPLFEELERDSALSRHLHAKALGILRTPARREEFINFTIAIALYFEVVYDPDRFPDVINDPGVSPNRFAMNPGGLKAHNDLSKITGKSSADDEKRSQAKRSLYRTLDGIQSRYQVVHREYSRLRDQLLSPI
jgi:hypothetical protein